MNLENLYDFQKVSVSKLRGQPSRLIGDEMGTGKTYQAIALDFVNRELVVEKGNWKKDQLKTLVIAPLSVLDSWRHHFEELTDIPVVVIDPKKRADFIKAVSKSGSGVFICHWDAIRLMPELTSVSFFHIIADEVHRAKNRKAQQTRALKKLKAAYKTGLSGTAADNKPHDLWSILHWLHPKYYTSYWKFYNHYVQHEVSYPQGYHKITGVKNLESLHKEMNPWYIRRLKSEVLQDLPEKYYTDIWVDLTPKQRKAYDEMKKNMIAWVSQHEDTPAPLVASVVIAQLTRLQQFALGYADVVNGEVRLTEPSSKLDALMEIMEDNPEEQFVVFSQFKQVIALLEKRLEAKGITYGLLTGDVSPEDRAKAVNDFQAGKLKVFAGTIAAGGVGITLTAANKIVFLDRAWSPALNAQAEDRLHRIGQESAVQVIDIMARDTVDLGRRQKIQEKWEWIKAILGDHVDWDILTKEVSNA